MPKRSSTSTFSVRIINPLHNQKPTLNRRVKILQQDILLPRWQTLDALTDLSPQPVPLPPQMRLTTETTQNSDLHA
jgi:hypothetical protein